MSSYNLLWKEHPHIFRIYYLNIKPLLYWGGYFVSKHLTYILFYLFTGWYIKEIFLEVEEINELDASYPNPVQSYEQHWHNKGQQDGKLNFGALAIWASDLQIALAQISFHLPSHFATMDGQVLPL